MTEIQNSSKNIVNLGKEFSTLNQSSLHVLELHQSNQLSLREIIPQLHQGAQSFTPVVKLVDKLQQQIVNKADSLVKAQAELTKLVETLNNSTQQMNTDVKSVGNRFVESISNQTKVNQNQLQAVVDNIQQCINHLNYMKHENQKILEVLEKQIIKDKFGVSNLNQSLNKRVG